MSKIKDQPKKLQYSYFLLLKDVQHRQNREYYIYYDHSLFFVFNVYKCIENI